MVWAEQISVETDCEDFFYFLFNVESPAKHVAFALRGCSVLLVPPAGEACWWTIHPASKQRSEGEKVRVGDDLILVSVSSERYLVSVERRAQTCWDDARRSIKQPL